MVDQQSIPSYAPGGNDQKPEDQVPAAGKEPQDQDPRLKNVMSSLQIVALLIRATLQAASSECICSACNMLRRNASALDPFLESLAGGNINK